MTFNTDIQQVYDASPFVLPDMIDTPFYCELVIDKNGNCVGLHGSHDTALLYLASQETGITMDEIEAQTPPQFFADWREYLVTLSGAIVVRYDRQDTLPTITDAQTNTLETLARLDKIEANRAVYHQMVLVDRKTVAWRNR